MDIRICSLEKIEQMAKQPFEPSVALISITDVGAEEVKLSHFPTYLLRLHFDDITMDDEEAADTQTLFDRSKAEQIAKFVYQYKEEASCIICQCEYGMSRSAAVAAAIKEHFDHNGIEVFVHGEYYPNLHVYKLTKKALENYNI